MELVNTFNVLIFLSEIKFKKIKILNFNGLKIEVIKKLQTDKKVQNGMIRLVIPTEIGKVNICNNVSKDDRNNNYSNDRSNY